MPFNISFTRTFKHQPWTDSRDRVTADGENGFNVRFKALEADLDTLRERFIEVSAALNAVAAGGGADRVLTVSPLLVSTSGYPWDLSSIGIATKLSSDSKAEGAVQVQMPAAGVVSTFTVNGRNVGTGVLTVTLYRFDARGAQSQVAQVKVTGTATNTPFSVTQTANAHRIDPASSYYIYAVAQSSASSDNITINGLQIACAAA